MKFLKNTAVFLLTSFCMILLMEFYFTQTEMIENLNVKLDNKLGVIYSPNQKFTFFSEGLGMGKVNKYGLLGKEYSKKRTPNTFRIAVLGDSYVQGLQVLSQEHFVTKFQTKLNHDSTTEIEVLNFGVSGYGLNDMYYCYENRVQQFSPDLILYFIDKYDLQNPYPHRKELYPAVKIQNDSLKISYDFTNSKKYKLFTKVKDVLDLSYTSIMRNIYFLSYQGKLTILFDKFHIKPKTKKQVKIKDKEEGEIPKVSKLILQELKKQNAIIVYRDTLSQSSMSLIEDEIGLRTINLNDTLNSMKKNDIDPNYWKVTKQRGHWNRDGHKAVSLFLADKVKGFTPTK